jgi:hypothetical protein
MKNENRLPAGGEKRLKRYVESLRAEIDERVRRVYAIYG